MLLGADVIMCFDECTPFGSDYERVKKAVERTIDWARQCKHWHNKKGQLLFGIVQGSIEPDLREYCSKELVQIGFDGYAIGGLSVGEGHSNMIKMTEHTAGFLPEDKPRYLMGVGTPCDIIAAVAAGVDMFDCVMPTRNGRNAYAFTEDGPLRMRNSDHIGGSEPIEADCDCYCCRNFSRGSVRHFFNINEMLGPILVSIHNIRFYQRLMSEMRECIKQGGFGQWASDKLQKYRVFSENNP